MRTVGLGLLLGACTASTFSPRPPPAAAPLDLVVDPLVTGWPVSIEVYGATPGAQVRLVRADGGFGEGVPLPHGARMGIEAGASGYRVLLSRRADAAGTARWFVDEFADYPAHDWYFQALELNATSTRVSNPLFRPTNGETPTQRRDPFVNSPYRGDAERVFPGQTVERRACDGDNPWFTTEVPAHQTVRVASRPTPDAAAWPAGAAVTWLWTAEGSHFNLEDDSSPFNLAHRWTNDSDTAAQLWIIGYTLGYFDGCLPYELDISLHDPDAPCVDDPHPNDDTLVSARRETVGDTATGRLCGSDQDWLRYTAPADGELALELHSSGGPPPQLAVADDTGRSLPLTPRPRPGQWETVAAPVVAGRDYWVRLSSTDANLDWTLHTMLLDAVACDPVVGTAEHPVSLNAGTTHRRACGSQREYFRVPVVPDRILDVQVRTLSSSYSYETFHWLYDEHGGVMREHAAPRYTRDPSTLHIRDFSNNGRSRLLEVFTPSNSFDTEIRIAHLPVLSCTPDGHEPNDDEATATVIPIGHAAAGRACQSDPDLYAIDVQAGQILHLGVDWEVGAYAPPSWLLRDDLGMETAHDGMHTWTAARQGRIYIVVPPTDPTENGGAPYSVHVDEVALPSDPYEPNDSRAAATPMSLPTFSATSAMDDDWYRFEVEPRTGVRIGFEREARAGETSSTTSASTRFYVENSAGEVIAQGRSSVSLLAPDDGVLNLHVPGGVSARRYNASLQLSPPCIPEDPRESPAQATPITDGETFSGAACATVGEWWWFDATQWEAITLDVVFYSSVHIVDSEGAIIHRFHGTTRWIAPETGRYYVRFLYPSNIPQSAAYEGMLTRESALSCVDDASEPDDSQGAAAPVLNGATTGVSCLGNEDWRTVDVVAGEPIMIRQVSGSSSLDISLFDDVGEEVTLERGMFARAHSDGMYALRIVQPIVDPLDLEAGQAYSIDVTLPGRVPCVPDGFEPDDDRAAATAVSDGTWSGFTGCWQDADWFAIDAEEGDRIVFSLARFTHDWPVVTLWSPQDEVMSTSVLQVSADATESGTHYVSVETTYLATPSGWPYEVSVRLTPPTPTPTTSPCGQDAWEPNDDPSTSHPMQSGTPLNAMLCSVDTDFFHVPMERGEGLRVDVSSSLFEVEFPPSTAQTVGVSRFPSSPVVLATADGDASIRVSTTRQGSYVYTLEATVIPACLEDALAPNDTMLHAAPLAPGTMLDLGLCPTGPDPAQDWFRIDLATGETLDIWAAFDPDEGDIDLMLHDVDGEIVEWSATTAETEEITWAAEQDGPVFLQVQLWEDVRDQRMGSRYDLISEITP